MLSKPQLKRLEDSVRRVLLDVWAPLGADVPDDEYDCCVGPLVRLLVERHSDSELVDYLFTRATEHIGVSASREEMLPTVTALRQIPLA